MFVVCGEALMDVFDGGQTATGNTLNAVVGGSPFNVAVGLSRLNQQAALLASVSTDFLGERLIKALKQEGVVLDTVVRTPAPTTLGLVGLDSHGVPAYSFIGTSDRQVTRDALQKIPAAARVFHFGSYAMVVDPIAATLRELVQARTGDALISYDPNIRLNIEPNIGRWREILGWMVPRTHLLKVSDEDLSHLYPGAAPESLAAGWLQQGVGMVVVTRGARGAIAFTAKSSAEAASPPITVVDTVGAGDTLQAALLTWLAEHDSLRPAAIAALSSEPMKKALVFATQAAAITCSRRGADLPRRAELPPA